MRAEARASDEKAMETVEKIRELTQHKRAAKKIARNRVSQCFLVWRTVEEPCGQAEIRNLLDSVKSRPRFAKMVECRPFCGRSVSTFKDALQTRWNA